MQKFLNRHVAFSNKNRTKIYFCLPSFHFFLNMKHERTWKHHCIFKDDVRGENKSSESVTLFTKICIFCSLHELIFTSTANMRTPMLWFSLIYKAYTWSNQNKINIMTHASFLLQVPYLKKVWAMESACVWWNSVYYYGHCKDCKRDCHIYVSKPYNMFLYLLKI